MALVFYIHGKDEKIDGFYANYTGKTDWNKDHPNFPPSTPTFAAMLDVARTEAGFKTILTCDDSKLALKGEKVVSQSGEEQASNAVEFLGLVGKDDQTIYVLKGVHQERNPHATLGWAGQFFHVEVQSGRNGKANLFKVTGISAGNVVKDDPEWTVQTKGKKGRKR